MSNLKNLVSPQSVAIIGASDNPSKIGYQILDNIIKAGYKGKLFPINLNGGEILSKEVKKSVNEISDELDLAVIVIPSKFVKEAVLDCVKKKVKSLIIISAGFGETGEDGKALQDEIVEICKKANITLLGPNCLGLINTGNGLNATFAKDMPNAGGIALLSQSGAIITSLIDWSLSNSIGFSKIFSVGNQALLSDADLLEYLYDDDKTKVIIAYVEKLVINDRLTQVFLKNAKKKPTIVLFGGKSAFGAKAALSHTGSVVTSYVSIKTFLEQSGVVIADSLEDLLLYARGFSSYQKISGKRVAVITNAGGPSIAAADNIDLQKLEMADFSPETIEALSKTLRPESNIKNPVDILGDAGDLEYQKAIEIVSKDKNTDAIIVILTPQSSTKIDETAQILAKYKGDKVLFGAFVGGEVLVKPKLSVEKSGHACFSYPEEAIQAISALCKYSLDKQTILPKKSATTQKFDLEDKNDILEEFHLPIVRYFKSEHDHELQDFADKIGYPVVLKTADETAHKSDSGLVILNIENHFELKSAFVKVGAPAIVGKMVKTKHEIMLGVKKEENVGTTVLFGTGGIFSEIIQDFSYRIAPLNRETALAMIMETKIGKILDGARSQHKYDLNKLADIIVNAAKFADTYENIQEIDFNPIIADATDFYMVDVRIITNEKGDK
jgi:acetyltransferase